VKSHPPQLPSVSRRYLEQATEHLRRAIDGHHAATRDGYWHLVAARLLIGAAGSEWLDPPRVRVPGERDDG